MVGASMLPKLFGTTTEALQPVHVLQPMTFNTKRGSGRGAEGCRQPLICRVTSGCDDCILPKGRHNKAYTGSNPVEP